MRISRWHENDPCCAAHPVLNLNQRHWVWTPEGGTVVSAAGWRTVHHPALDEETFTLLLPPSGRVYSCLLSSSCWLADASCLVRVTVGSSLTWLLLGVAHTPQTEATLLGVKTVFGLLMWSLTVNVRVMLLNITAVRGAWTLLSDGSLVLITLCYTHCATHSVECVAQCV